MAVWLAPGRVTVGPWDYQRRLTAACGPYLSRFQALDRLLESRHPVEAHRHLAFVATHPDRQGAGRADALLSHAGTRRGNVPTCGWAITATGRRLLTNHGFVKRDPVALPDGAGQVVPMWRPADT